MLVRWYYQLLMEEFGPVPVEQILNMRAESVLQDGDLVRSEAGGDWITIAMMKSVCQPLDSAESPAAEEISDLSELNFVFENSRTTSRPAVTADHSAKPQQWFCQTLGQTLGPMSLHELRSLAESGALSADDMVRCGESEAWLVAGSSPHISNALARGKPASLDSAATTSGTRKQIEHTTAEKPRHSEVPILRKEKSAATEVKRKRRPTSNDDQKVVRSKRISSNGVGVDEELPNDVFNDDVQKQDSTSQKSLSATASMATSSTSTGLAGTAASRGTMGTPSSMSSNPPYSTAASSSPKPVSASYPASPSMSSAPPRMAYTPPKKSVSVSEPMDLKKVGTVAGAITVIASVLAISIFGLPFGGGGPAETPFDPKATVAVLKMIMKNFDDLTRTTDESAFNECMDNVKPQMSAILAKTQDPQNNTPEAAACQAATKALMKIADSLPDKQEEIEQGVAEFHKQIALVH